MINEKFAHQLMSEQFPEYDHLSIVPVEKQGYDNRTFRLGDKTLDSHSNCAMLRA
jgi:aminoglycoside phosphotransferase (APT) family kinase protein